MKIKIKPDRWNHLKEVSGKWLTVETEYLFRDQFNTEPVKGISASGFRVMIADVDEIKDDARIGRQRCGYCGKNSDFMANACPHCDKSEYLERFEGRFSKRPNQVKPEAKPLYIPGSKDRFRRPMYLVYDSVGSSGVSLDAYDHIVSVVGGYDRGNGFQEYRSFSSFIKEANPSMRIFCKFHAEKMAKAAGY